ncbi:hypothetical protein ACJX0J_039142 [Zea mays]
MKLQWFRNEQAEDAVTKQATDKDATDWRKPGIGKTHKISESEWENGAQTNSFSFSEKWRLEILHKSVFVLFNPNFQILSGVFSACAEVKGYFQGKEIRVLKACAGLQSLEYGLSGLGLDAFTCMPSVGTCQTRC